MAAEATERKPVPSAADFCFEQLSERFGWEADSENDGLKWPHCDGLNWPHLRPTGGRLFELYRARAEGARGNGIQGGAVRADQTGP